MTSPRRHAHAGRRRAGRTPPPGWPVSVSGTAAVPCRREVDDRDPGHLLTRSNTVAGDFSAPPPRQPVSRRTSTRTSAAARSESLSDYSPTEPSNRRRLPPSSTTTSFSVELVASDHRASSRLSSAAGRSSTVSPSDLIRLADDKFDRQRAAAAAAARRRFVLMTTRSRNQPLSAAAAAAADTEGFRELSPRSSSRRTVPSDGACFLRYATNVDLADGDTRLEEPRM